ncbi:DUF4259 domain-containing protein [Kitasatospora sp. NPDC003701]
MGSWGTGPFDSDHAADFANEVDRARPHQRHTVIQHRLTRYTEAAEPDDYVQDEAIAAAALVAAQCPGGLAIEGAYGPQKPIPELPSHLRPLATTALDRVLANAQSTMGRWFQRESAEQWLEGVEHLRTLLDPTTPYTTAYVPGPLQPHEIGTRTVHEAFGVDRIRYLPGAGEPGPRGMLVRQLNQAALKLDAAQRDLLEAVDTSLTHLDSVRRDLQGLADGEIREVHKNSAPAFLLHTALGVPLAARAERHQRLVGLIDLYRELSAAPSATNRATAARTRSTLTPSAPLAAETNAAGPGRTGPQKPHGR